MNKKDWDAAEICAFSKESSEGSKREVEGFVNYVGKEEPGKVAIMNLKNTAS